MTLAKCTEVLVALPNKYLQDLQAEQLEWKEQLEALETGKLHIGNPWEGRTEEKMHDLRRKIAEHQSLIERELRKYF